MTADKATHRLNQRKSSGLIKASLVVIGLIAAGIVAVTVAENMGRPVHAVAASTSRDGANVPNQQLSSDEFLSSNLNDKISSPISGPRECRPELGIVNDCTYQ